MCNHLVTTTKPRSKRSCSHPVTTAQKHRWKSWTPPSTLAEGTSAKQFLANYSINSRRFQQGFFFFFLPFSSLNLELYKIISNRGSEENQTETAGETIRDKAGYSVQGNHHGRLKWVLVGFLLLFFVGCFFFFFSFKTRKKKKAYFPNHFFFFKHSPPASNRTRLTIRTHEYIHT